ncbi:zymogen granule membrane protein 16-like [Centroberyx gerrardi]|uniref:zymogen granule membrane protein 16-like n=1 Tax=Centroberyx gerrardi TaxID=166262 RepID=UPI003AAE7EA6
MFAFLFLAVMCASCLAKPVAEYYSFSVPVGSGSGTAFSSTGDGRITGIRIWEISSAYITGIQLRYGYIWSELLGRQHGEELQIDLHDGEAIIQISGKYYVANYIYQVAFVTNRGRSLTAGQPTQTSFNFYPTHPDTELRMLSGRFNGHGITSLGAHWGMVYMEQGNGNTTQA